MYVFLVSFGLSFDFSYLFFSIAILSSIWIMFQLVICRR